MYIRLAWRRRSLSLSPVVTAIAAVVAVVMSIGIGGPTLVVHSLWGSCVQIGAIQIRLAWPLHSFLVSCLDDTLKSRSVKHISMAPSQFWRVLLGLHAQIEKCKSDSHGSTAVCRCRQSSPPGLSLSPSSSALGSLGPLFMWIPFGAHAFKLERYREDQHGPARFLRVLLG